MTRPTHTAAAAAAATLALLTTGCATEPPAIGQGPVYPATTQSRVVDIQVLRQGTDAVMTNTTTQRFTAARLWANAWYSRDLQDWAPGQTITLPLDSFKDRYGVPFRAGGFFATTNPEKLVLMQIEHDNTLTGLIVIGQSE